MGFDALLVAILFTIPGLLAWELANLFTPHKTKRSEKQFAVHLIFFGCICLSLVAIFRSTSPHSLIQKLSQSGDNDGWAIYIETGSAVIVLAGIIVLWRLLLYPLIERFVRKAFRYYGEVYVWESVIAEIELGRFVQVFTVDHWYYLGEIERSPTIVNDRDIYIRVQRFGKYDDKGELLFQVDDITEDHIMFVPAEQISRLAVIRERFSVEELSRMKTIAQMKETRAKLKDLNSDSNPEN